MEEHPLNESAWRRGWQDTKAVWTSWPFYVFTAIGGIMVGGILEWYWGIVLVGFGLICAWMGATVKAPIKQRDEARTLLKAKPKPIPLQNRKELIGAIANIEKTTLEVIKRQDSIDRLYARSAYPETAGAKDLTDARDKAYSQWNDSMNSLRREYLVAGEAYEKIAVDFTGFIGIQVMSKLGQLKYTEDTKPIVLQNTLQFVGVLAARVKETIRKIDELSGQASHK